MIGRKFVDQMGREIHVPLEPKRIISLVPSQTELLYDLGLDSEVIGITKFCIHPAAWFRVKQRIGWTKQLNLELIRSLNPDLIIGNKEENTKEDIEALAKEFPVWMSDIVTLEDAFAMIHSIGVMTEKEDEAELLVEESIEAFSSLQNLGQGKTFLYFIWDDPAFLTGKNTFIDSMLTKIGYKNACDLERYPALTDCPNVQPDVVFLSSEPYPFKENHRQKFQEMFPKADIRMIDGEMCSWYGSRMKLAATYFENFAPPDL
jgi:ABC-type Fe3+-hydroxamate transport system substrate-binding protein